MRAPFGLVAILAALPGCSALGLFDAMPATACVNDDQCQISGLVEDPCVHFACDLTTRFCVPHLADHDGDGQSPIGCASSHYASIGHPTDCDDSDTFTNAGALEICSQTDNDCDGTVDEDCVTPQITSGAFHNCYLAGPTLVCWGANLHGELGTGVPMEFGTHPRSVVGLSDATSITAGGDASCATVRDGRTFCWGSNEHGQLATTTPTNNVYAPVEVPALEGATHLSLGDSHGCALLDGDVVCWGFNESGQLGDGTTNDSSVPLVVPGTRGAVAVSAGSGASCAVLGDGSVACWGTGSVPFACPAARAPCAIPGLDGAIDVQVGLEYACARRDGGAAACWGNDTTYVVGAVAAVGGPIEVYPIDFATPPDGLATGTLHACLVSEGRVRCWGDNTAGQLGPMLSTFQVTPVLTLLDYDDVAALDAGAGHTCVLRRTGDVLCWGVNEWGQLGGEPSNQGEATRPLGTWVADGRP